MWIFLLRWICIHKTAPMPLISKLFTQHKQVQQYTCKTYVATTCTYAPKFLHKIWNYCRWHCSYLFVNLSNYANASFTGYYTVCLDTNHQLQWFAILPDYINSEIKGSLSGPLYTHLTLLNLYNETNGSMVYKQIKQQFKTWISARPQRNHTLQRTLQQVEMHSPINYLQCNPQFFLWMIGKQYND